MPGYFVDTNIWIAFHFKGTRELWLELAAIPSASPKVWMNAYLAAFVIRAGLPFATLDTDFRRFEAAGLQLNLLTA